MKISRLEARDLCQVDGSIEYIGKHFKSLPDEYFELPNVLDEPYRKRVHEMGLNAFMEGVGFGSFIKEDEEILLSISVSIQCFDEVDISEATKRAKLFIEEFIHMVDNSPEIRVSHPFKSEYLDFSINFEKENADHSLEAYLEDNALYIFGYNCEILHKEPFLDYLLNKKRE